MCEFSRARSRTEQPRNDNLRKIDDGGVPARRGGNTSKIEATDLHGLARESGR